MSYYTKEEKIEILTKNGWYEHYDPDFWRKSDMTEHGGADLESAFRSCLKSKIDMSYEELRAEIERTIQRKPLSRLHLLEILFYLENL